MFCDREFGAGRRLVDHVVDVVGGVPRPNLALHRVDDVRHGLDQLAERRSLLGVRMPARQHHTVPNTHGHRFMDIFSGGEASKILGVQEASAGTGRVREGLGVAPSRRWSPG